MQSVYAVELIHIGFRRVRVLKGTEVELDHVLDGVVACVVHNDIHYHANAVLMRGVHQLFELLFCTEVLVGLGVVEHVIAVVGIVREVKAVAGGNVAVDLLIGSGYPDGVYAQLVKVAFLQLLGNAGEVAAVEGTRAALPARKRLAA